LLNRLDSVSDTDRQQIEKSFHRLTNKLLHPPLESVSGIDLNSPFLLAMTVSIATAGAAGEKVHLAANRLFFNEVFGLQ